MLLAFLCLLHTGLTAAISSEYIQPIKQTNDSANTS